MVTEIHKQDGVMIYDKCPWCDARIMKNAVGNKWCSNMACDYHIRDGKPAVMPKQTILAD